MTRSRVLKVLAVVLVALVVAGTVGFLWYAQPQPLLPEATAALASTEGATFEQGADGRLTFTPTGTAPTTGLILYPGGKVPPAAYAPAARAIAEHGYLVSIVPVPFNLAVFGIDAAAAVIADHPEIDHWVVGGHSLGGVMAAQFASAHPDAVDGLLLWASYSSADVSAQDLTVASVYGSLDGGRTSFSDPANLAKLGPNVTTSVIDGGNHEQMGWYTGQPNDPPAAIDRAEQQARLVAASVDLLEQVSGGADAELAAA
jgi:dienelactone hydrolase